MARPKVDYKYWEKNCNGIVPGMAAEDETGHVCPLVIYENEDGRCSHHACEGPHPDCGKVVEVQCDT